MNRLRESVLDWAAARVAKSAVSGSVRVLGYKSAPEQVRGLSDSKSKKASSLLSEEDLFRMFEIQPPIGGAITKKGRIFMGADWSFVTPKGADPDEDERGRLSALFDWPSGDESFSVVLCRTLMRLDILGNCYWHWTMPGASKELVRAVITETAKELHQRFRVPLATVEAVVKLSAQKAAKLSEWPVGFYLLEGAVEANLDKRGNFTDPDKGYKQTVGVDEQWFRWDEVTHFKVPDPRKRSYGLPRLACLALVNQMDQQAQLINDSLLKRQGRPGGILSIRDASETERDRLEATFEQKFVGGTEDDPRAFEMAGRVLAVRVSGDRGQVEYVPLEMKPSEMQLSDLLEWSRLNYGMVHGVHGGMLGVTRDVNRSNMEMSAYDLTENELGPTAKLIADQVNKDLRDVRGVASTLLQIKLKDLRSEQERARTSKMWQDVGAESLNERMSALGKPPVPGGDAYLHNLGPGIFAFHPEKEPVLITLQQGVLPLGEVLCTADELARVERVEPIAFPGTGAAAASVGTFEALPAVVREADAPTVAEDLVGQLLALSESLSSARAERGM